MAQEISAAAPSPVTCDGRRPWMGRIPWGWIALALLIAARITLISNLPLYAIGPSPHDDAWFVGMAEHIYHGEWLGPYNQLTLIKGQGFPLFVAAAHILGMPLRRAQEGLYILSCLAMLAALWPRVRAWPLRVAVLAVLLLNPMSFRAGELGRVLREGIYPAQTCLVLALAIGLLLRRDQRWGVQCRWAAALGAALGWFWITREEAIWIIPALGLILLPLFWAVLRRRGERLQRAAVLVVAAVPAVAIVNVICLMNLWWYGAYVTVEFRSREFAAAYGALLRIDTGEFRGRVPISDKAIALAGANSPAFARVQKLLQGEVMAAWRRGPVNAEGQRQYDGNFIWALRDSVYLAARPRSAGEALGFYRRIAREINKACDEGRIPAGPRQMIELPWDRRYLPALLQSARESSVMLVTFKYAGAGASRSVGTPEARDWFSKVTRSDMTPLRPVGQNVPGWGKSQRGLRHSCRLYLARAYHWGTGIALGLSALVGIVCIRHLWRRQADLLLCIAALAVVVAARIGILSWIDITAFDAINPVYLSPAYVPMLCIPLVMLVAAVGRRDPPPPASPRQ